MVEIKLAVLGHLPYALKLTKIVSWTSCLFKVEQDTSKYPITENSDNMNWSYTDENIEKHLPARNGEHILIAITNVPLEKNYFARRFSDNRICVTYHEIIDILQKYNIPLENFILRVLYAMSIVYQSNNGKIPCSEESSSFLHDETRGCVYDMCGRKVDIFYSLYIPQLCADCVHDLTHNRTAKIDSNLIPKIQRELRKIRKERYYQILDFVKRRPVLTLILSTIATFTISVIGSFLATLILELWR